MVVYQATAPTLIFLLKEGSRKNDLTLRVPFLHEDPVSYALLLHQPLALSKPTSITTRSNFALPAENSRLIPAYCISTPPKEIQPTPNLVFLLKFTIYK